ncbi:MAG: hypothetical protein KDC00_04805 [Flavobacteriales bacterium]|nr:hypothetical protein [Flavobacteriales bacterium]
MLSFRACLLPLPLFMAMVACGQTNRNSEIRVLTGLNVGASLARLAADSAGSFNTTPWVSVTLDLGVSLTHRNKWGTSLMGSYAMNGYNYVREDMEYDVYHLNPRAEARVWWLFPFSPEHGTFLRIGTGFGYSFIGNDELRYTADRFTAVSTSTARNAPFISPEIGLSNTPGRHCFDIGLRYVRHLQREPAFTTTLTANGMTTVGSATNDHLGLVFRYHIGFNEKAKPTLRVPPIILTERRTDTLTTLSTARQRITMHLWDNAEYDGDTVTVLLNNRPVLVGHELTHKKKRITLELTNTDNTLLVIAHNEGRVAPNTASCVVRKVGGQKELLIRTSQATNMAIVIRKD